MDNLLDKILAGFFATSGMTILTLTWVQTLSPADRMAAVFVGIVALVWALGCVLASRSRVAKMDSVKIAAESQSR